MIVFVVYSGDVASAVKIIDGPASVVLPLSVVTMWRQEASVSPSPGS